MTTKDNGFRYWRWRFAIKRPQWAIDRHWYAFMGRLGESLRLVLHYFDVMSSYPRAMLTLDSLDPKFGSAAPKGTYGHMVHNPKFDPLVTVPMEVGASGRWVHRDSLSRDNLSSASLEVMRGPSLGTAAMQRFRARGQTS